MPTVAVIGASADRSKYGNKAVRAYARRGWTVFPIHPTEDTIEGLKAYPSIRDVPAPIDRAVLYLPPETGLKVLPDIAAAKPGAFFVNPGAESAALLRAAKELGLDPILACAITEVGERPGSL